MSSSSSKMMWEIDQEEEELFNQSEGMFNAGDWAQNEREENDEHRRREDGERTNQEWHEPHIPVESSKLWLRYAGPTVL